MISKTRMIAESSLDSTESRTLRWSVERRLADIARYLGHQPRGLSYDKSAKRYVAGDDFRPALAAPDAARFLGELRLVDLGILDVADTFLGEAPPFDATPVPA